MDFRLAPHEEALRREVCDWLTKELGTSHASDPVPMPPGYMPDRQFELKMGQTGWLAISWPEEYGGRGRPIGEQFIVEKEIALHGGNASDALTRCIIAPMIIAAANDDQKRRYLPGMARGAITACLGYSEPGSGSDFASLQTKAERDGDDYIINGQKIWTSGAESSEYCWLAARTGSEGAKHGGISVFMVPM
ncbi:MAG: acyl-CoA dehydrogenase family protein, partial [Chloroflexota bacterium]